MHYYSMPDLGLKVPQELQDLIDLHRAQFGGWKMEGDEDGSGSEGGEGGSSKPDDKADKPDDKPLGPNGEKALSAERDARKAIEAEFAQFKAGLAAALGGTDKDAKSTDDVLATVQQKLAAMEHSNLVLTVASTNKITDDEDLGLLRDFKGDEAGLRKLAARLKPSDEKADPPTPQKRRIPAPDPSQGRGSGSDSAGRPSSVAQVMAERRTAREAKSK